MTITVPHILCVILYTGVSHKKRFKNRKHVSGTDSSSAAFCSELTPDNIDTPEKQL